MRLLAVQRARPRSTPGRGVPLSCGSYEQRHRMPLVEAPGAHQRQLGWVGSLLRLPVRIRLQLGAVTRPGHWPEGYKLTKY